MSSLLSPTLANFLSFLSSPKLTYVVQSLRERVILRICPYGFDINGKYDCESSAQSGSLRPMFWFRNMHDNSMFEKNKKQVNLGQLLQLKVCNLHSPRDWYWGVTWWTPLSFLHFLSSEMVKFTEWLTFAHVAQALSCVCVRLPQKSFAESALMLYCI